MIEAQLGQYDLDSEDASEGMNPDRTEAK